MTKQNKWSVLLSVVCVLFVFCVVRAVRRPAASDAAQRIEVGESPAQVDEEGTDTRFQTALESLEADHVQAANELQQRQLETAGEAQRIEQQEAAAELLRRQQEAARPQSGNPRLVS